MMVLILGVVIATMVSVGFGRINRFVIDAEEAHLETAANQVRTDLQTSLDRIGGEAARLAATAAVGRAASAFATTSDRAAAQHLIAAEMRRSPRAVAVALWSADGRLVAFDGDREMADVKRPRFRDRSADDVDTATFTVGPLSARRDTLFYAVTTRVLGADSATQGYVVLTRSVANDAESATLLSGLVGPDARVMLGNAIGGPWTDLAHVVPGFDVAPDPGTGEHVAKDGASYLYAVAAVPGTPWRVMVDMPRRFAVAATRSFALEIAVVAALLILLGATLVWIVIRRSLRPLASMTDAVVGLSKGERTRRVSISTDDEVGKLADAFNSMVEQVQQSAAEATSRAEALEISNHELQESEQRYRVLFDHLPDGIMVHRDRRIAFINPACARLLGDPSVDGLIGRSVMDFVESDEHAMVIQRLARVQEGVAVPMREMRLQRADGRRVVVESTNVSLVHNGAPAVQTILHDVTDRHLLEERFRQSQKMEAVGRLAGGIAHDFNNLLTVIDAHADFALRTDESQETRLADIDEIKRASGSAARLTRQLLTFSRKRAIAPARIDLSAAVKDVLVMLNRLIGDDLRVDTDLADSVWPVHADPGHIEQVLVNLALNARDAMPRGGTLSFATANFHVSTDYRTPTGEAIPDGDYVALSIQDTGAGMTEEVRSKVFEPFFTTKQTGRGTGLGLATVYGIVQQSNGYIWLLSEVGRGTTFTVLLPRYAGEEATPGPVRAGDARAPAIAARILVVEDQANVRIAISRSLRNAGYTVTDVPDAEQALRVLAADPGVDLIVTDMVMPGKTGAELVGEVAITHPGIPFAIMSGYSEEMSSREWRLPANAVFIEKPVSPRRLVEVISELLGNARQVG